VKTSGDEEHERVRAPRQPSARRSTGGRRNVAARGPHSSRVPNSPRGRTISISTSSR
jgi:hypothetical protein